MRPRRKPQRRRAGADSPLEREVVAVGRHKSSAADEALQLGERVVVRNLPRRMLAEGRCGRMDRSRHAAVEGDAGATDEVDGDTRAVG